MLEPVVTVRLNGTEVDRLAGAVKWGGPGALVQIAEMDPGNPYPEDLLSSFAEGAHTVAI